jgi:hypothetical protein
VAEAVVELPLDNDPVARNVASHHRPASSQQRHRHTSRTAASHLCELRAWMLREWPRAEDDAR